jgi:hypothetical protein
MTKNTGGGAQPHRNKAALAKGTAGTDNPAPCSTSGLDIQGQFRIGERITLGVRGGGLVLTQSHSGREVEVSEAALAGLLDDEYFVDKRD